MSSENSNTKPTHQSIVDDNYKGYLLERQPPSYGMRRNGTPGCLYLSPEGHRCGIGRNMPLAMVEKIKALGISDRNINAIMDTSEHTYCLEAIEWFSQCNGEFLMQAQNAHDVAAIKADQAFPSDNLAPEKLEMFRRLYRDNLAALCRNWHLEWPEDRPGVRELAQAEAQARELAAAARDTSVDVGTGKGQ